MSYQITLLLLLLLGFCKLFIWIEVFHFDLTTKAVVSWLMPVRGDVLRTACVYVSVLETSPPL